MRHLFISPIKSPHRSILNLSFSGLHRRCLSLLSNTKSVKSLDSVTDAVEVSRLEGLGFESDINKNKPSFQLSAPALDLMNGLLNGDRGSLARVITLVESWAFDKRAVGQEILTRLMDQLREQADQANKMFRDAGAANIQRGSTFRLGKF
ncbi:unnamed protein product [Protopolystoma xenopodis]|uniref:Uncharacterized protein n=1 Tax=Protopolystoma xenopodis TaxID=117903 RepID=A0A448X5S9_9PLAT|nr:unnamed protein product [Protopolystoma xenopodis]